MERYAQIDRASRLWNVSPWSLTSTWRQYPPYFPLSRGQPVSGTHEIISILYSHKGHNRRGGVPQGTPPLTPLREGRPGLVAFLRLDWRISTHAPAGGATVSRCPSMSCKKQFLLTPLREGRPRRAPCAALGIHFYSRPCGRGDPHGRAQAQRGGDFYSRPCGRGDLSSVWGDAEGTEISTHAPAGGATLNLRLRPRGHLLFLLTPLREGRPLPQSDQPSGRADFYSRPCGRGDR